MTIEHEDKVLCANCAYLIRPDLGVYHRCAHPDNVWPTETNYINGKVTPEFPRACYMLNAEGGCEKFDQAIAPRCGGVFEGKRGFMRRIFGL